MTITDSDIVRRIGEIHVLTDEAEKAKQFVRANAYYREALDLIPKMTDRARWSGMKELIRKNMELNVRLATAQGRPFRN